MRQNEMLKRLVERDGRSESNATCFLRWKINFLVLLWTEQLNQERNGTNTSPDTLILVGSAGTTVVQYRTFLMNFEKAEFEERMGTDKAEQAAEGVLVCCGRSSDYQLGFITNEPVQWTFRPIRTLQRIIQVSSGTAHNLALDATGSVHVWGIGKYGRLGLGDELYRATPVRIDPSAFGMNERIIQVSAGSEHSGCISESGRLYTWGCNINGQLGHNLEQTHLLSPRMVSASSLVTPSFDSSFVSASRRKSNSSIEGARFQAFSVISCGRKHTLALLADGTVLSCGSNAMGELGITGSRAEVNRRFVVMDEPLVENDRSGVNVADNSVEIHSRPLFIASDEDDNDNLDRGGSLGRKRITGSKHNRVVGISAGYDSSAVWKSSGALFVLGLGQQRPQKAHFKDEFHVHVVHCTLSRDTMLILSQDGRVFSRERRGGNVSYSMSSPTAASPIFSSSPVDQSTSFSSETTVPRTMSRTSKSYLSYWSPAVVIATLENIADISCSGGHCAAVDQEGHLFTWEQCTENDDEALGFEKSTSRRDLQSVSGKGSKRPHMLVRLVRGLSGIVQVSCGLHHTIAIMGFTRPGSEEDDDGRLGVDEEDAVLARVIHASQIDGGNIDSLRRNTAAGVADLMFTFDADSEEDDDNLLNTSSQGNSGVSKMPHRDRGTKLDQVHVPLLSDLVVHRLERTMDCFNFHTCFKIAQELHLPRLMLAVERFVLANFDVLNYLNPNAMRLFEFEDDEEEVPSESESPECDGGMSEDALKVEKLQPPSSSFDSVAEVDFENKPNELSSSIVPRSLISQAGISQGALVENDGNDPLVRCVLCDMNFSCNASLQVHLNGKRHASVERRRLDMHQLSSIKPDLKNNTKKSLATVSQRERKIKLREERERRRAEEQATSRSELESILPSRRYKSVTRAVPVENKWAKNHTQGSRPSSHGNLPETQGTNRKPAALREILQQQEQEAGVALSSSLEKQHHQSRFGTKEEALSILAKASWAAKPIASPSSIVPVGVEIGNDTIAVGGSRLGRTPPSSSTRKGIRKKTRTPPIETTTPGPSSVASTKATSPLVNFREILKTEDELAKKEAALRASRPLNRSAWGFIPHGSAQ